MDQCRGCVPVQRALLSCGVVSPGAAEGGSDLPMRRGRVRFNENSRRQVEE